MQLTYWSNLMLQSAFRNNTSNWRNLALMTSSFFPAKKVILHCWGWKYSWLPHGYQTVGEGLPTSADILVSSPSEHLNEPQLAWRPLFLEWGNRVRFPFGSQSSILTLGEKHRISFRQGDWTSTGARLTAGQCNEFVFPSRIFDFHSHDHIGPYSSLTQISKILERQFSQSNLTPEFSLEHTPQWDSTLTCWPLWSYYALEHISYPP